MRILLSFLCLIFISTSIFSQNVGIGTSSPTEKLHVNGNIKVDTLKSDNIKMTSNAAEGKVLTSDASGNGSWQQLSAGNNVPAGAGFGSWGDCRMNSVSEYLPMTDTVSMESYAYGRSIAIAGNTALVGNPAKANAYVYNYDGTNWKLVQQLRDPALSDTSGFGISVAISGDWALVGVPLAYVGENQWQGVADLFHYNGSGWVFAQQIKDPSGTALDVFGFGIAISGDNLIVGSYLDDVNASVDQGSACVFHYNGSSWVFVQKIIDGTGATNDGFGVKVAISGNLAVIASPFDDIGTNTDYGSVSLYKLNGANWTLLKKMTDSTATISNTRFGTGLSITNGYLAIGAPWFGTETFSASDEQRGIVNVYHYDGANWKFMEKIHASDSAHTSAFGSSISLSGDYMIIGEPSFSSRRPGPGVTGNRVGAADIYVRIGLHWQKVQLLLDPGAMEIDGFGNVVAIDGNNRRFIVGIPFYSGASGKVIFGRVN